MSLGQFWSLYFFYEKILHAPKAQEAQKSQKSQKAQRRNQAKAQQRK